MKTDRSWYRRSDIDRDIDPGLLNAALPEEPLTHATVLLLAHLQSAGLLLVGRPLRGLRLILVRATLCGLWLILRRLLGGLGPVLFLLAFCGFRLVLGGWLRGLGLILRAFSLDAFRLPFVAALCAFGLAALFHVLRLGGALAGRLLRLLRFGLAAFRGTL